MATPANPSPAANPPAEIPAASIVAPTLPEPAKLSAENLQFVLAMIHLGPVMVAEYRGEGQEVIKFTNKKTGAAEQFTKHALALEFGPDGAVEQMSADIDYPKGVDPSKTPYVKGQKLLLVLSGMLRTRDSITGSVKFHRPL